MIEITYESKFVAIYFLSGLLVKNRAFFGPSLPKKMRPAKLNPNRCAGFFNLSNEHRFAVLPGCSLRFFCELPVVLIVYRMEALWNGENYI